MWRLHVQWTHCCHHDAQLFCNWMWVLMLMIDNLKTLDNIRALISYFNCRHSAIVESGSHHLLGFKFVWHLLHPGSSWALLHRRVHRLLHHHPPLPLLPHLSQHARIPTEPEGADLVPHVLLLWVQCERARSQSVSLALWKARLHENSDWIELSYVDQRLHTPVTGNFFYLFLFTWAFIFPLFS